MVDLTQVRRRRSQDPGFLIDGYRPPAGGAAGLLAIEGVFLGFGTGFPSQKVVLA